VIFGVLAVLVAYLIGSIPFGYLAGWLKGVNLFEHGSQNIGATNAGRVLGRPYAVIVFVLDFLKGALPTAFIVPALDAISPDASHALGSPDWWRISAATATFLGHLYPITLGFRGGKGVATGAGIVAVLTPVPMLIALAVWCLTALSTRYVSVASILAALTVLIARCLLTPHAFGWDAVIITVFAFVGIAVVLVKHRTNMRRLWLGTENQISGSPRQARFVNSLSVFAAGLAFGSGFFFNFFAAPAIFDSFKNVVAEAPSDRTAMVPITPVDATSETKAALASALAGSAVGPIFPRYFAVQTGCAVVLFLTALGSARTERMRFILCVIVLLFALVGWPLSQEVSRLRLERFDPNLEIAQAAKAAFGPVHLVSLALSGLSSLLTGILLFRPTSLSHSRGKS
jgi:acyl phosphate:glycerol-3-phosphate acyltransferase